MSDLNTITTTDTAWKNEMYGVPAHVSLENLGPRWRAGEKISALAKEAGIPWQRLHAALLMFGSGANGGNGDGTGPAALDVKAVREIIREEMRTATPAGQMFTVKLPDGRVNAVKGKTHAEFENVLMLAAARRNVLLVGPAGCGKTHLGEQVALALDLPFAFIACSAGMSEGQLLGRLVPTGENGRFEYVRSAFVKCYEEGGVFLFDEIDAADANTLLVINSALANGKMSVPNRPGNSEAIKHADFVCLAAANTFGTGASRQYVGRNQLDESTLDRFRIGQIEMDYDTEVEAALCPNDALRTRLVAYRVKARAAGLRRVVSMRFVRDAFLMQEVGFSDEKIDKALFMGWTADEVAKVK